MTTYSGQDGVLNIDNGASEDTVAEIKSFSVEESADTLEDSAQGDSWRTRKPGLKSWSGSAEAHFDNTDTSGQGALTIGSEVDLVLYPSGETSGHGKLSGSAIVTGVSASSELEGIVSQSFTFEGNGALVRADVA